MSGISDESSPKNSERRDLSHGTRAAKPCVRSHQQRGGLAHHRIISRWTTQLQSVIVLFWAATLLLATVASAQAPSPSTSTSAATLSSTTSATRTIIASTLPTTLSLAPLNYSNPSIQIDLPTRPTFYITVNICSLGTNTSILPSALVSTVDTPSFALGQSKTDASSGGVSGPNIVSQDETVWKLRWESGFANWTWTDGDVGANILVGLGLGDDGQVDYDAVPRDLGNVVVQVSISTLGPLQRLSPTSLFLGDTTQNAALLLSPLLLSSPQVQPSYPNYTLPRAQLVLDSYSGSSVTSNLTSLSSGLSIVVVPTASSPTANGLDNSLCAVLSANSSTGYLADPGRMLVNSTTQWMSIAGEEGFRTMWVVGDLQAQTNYTAWLVDDQGGMSQPIWFTTKESSFACQLVLPNTMCPGVAYSAPLEANSSTITFPGSTTPIPLPLTSFPDDITALISRSLDAFSTSLLSSACGRDLFSHVSTCLDCYSAYRDWICRIAVPQCAPTSTGTSQEGAAVLPQTTARTTDEPRVANITASYAYEELLPCLSNCNNVDRKCPMFLAFRCPRRRVNAEQSYAFLGLDTEDGDGSADTGSPALDRWGNRWCNG